jgi:hypothetical protein
MLAVDPLVASNSSVPCVVTRLFPSPARAVSDPWCTPPPRRTTAARLRAPRSGVRLGADPQTAKPHANGVVLLRATETRTHEGTVASREQGRHRDGRRSLGRPVSKNATIHPEIHSPEGARRSKSAHSLWRRFPLFPKIPRTAGRCPSSPALLPPLSLPPPLGPRHRFQRPHTLAWDGAHRRSCAQRKYAQSFPKPFDRLRASGSNAILTLRPIPIIPENSHGPTAPAQTVCSAKPRNPSRNPSAG